jgi:hypothetical protein
MAHPESSAIAPAESSLAGPRASQGPCKLDARAAVLWQVMSKIVLDRSQNDACGGNEVL